MADEWIGIIETTRHKYMKGASDLTIRRRLLLAMLRRRGRLTYNNSGDECRWQVEFSQPPVSAYGDGGVIDFSNHDAYRQLGVDWRGYIATDTMSKKQERMNRGDEALVKVFSGKTRNLRKSIDNNFAGELYRNGSSAGRENNVHGLETFMAADGNTVVADKVANPSTTYGETSLSTALGNQAGSWSSDLATPPNATLATDWPDGQGDSEYDYLAPKLLNWSSTSWGTGTNTWEANCWRVISQMITWLTITGEGMPTLMPLAGNLFQGYKEAQEVKTRINIPHKESQDLGFGMVLNQDGCGIYPDFDCPVNTGYALKLDTIEIASLFPELFWMEGPDKDPRTAWSWLWGIGFYGNAKYQPKHTGKMYNYAAS